MLRFKADLRTVVYMVLTTGVFILQWAFIGFQPAVYFVYLFLSIAVTVIAHNHNHVPIWRTKSLNAFTDYWLTVFYGFPSFGWIPTHNLNHHTLNNREGDYTITYRLTEQNSLMMLLFYPTLSSYHQQKPIRDYLANLWRADRRKFYFSFGQYVALAVWIAVFLVLDWQKALLFVVIPQQVGLFAVLIFNYVQHVHADEESAWNHSRNFIGFLNTLLFNNGYHTVHHERSGTHWSVNAEEHRKVAHLISPRLIERSFWGYIVRNYFVGAVIPKYRTQSMRLERIAAQGTAPAIEAESLPQPATPLILRADRVSV